MEQSFRTRLTVSRAALVLACVTALAATSTPATAAGAQLDPTFSGNGWVRTLEVRGTHYAYQPEGAEDIAVQADGKIVAVGEMQDQNSNWVFGVLRYTPDGRLDETFGRGGWVATRLDSFPRAHAVEIQDDGKIVVAGETDCEHALCFIVVRYEADGDLDPTFAGDGIKRAMFGRRASRAVDVAIQDDGRIVVVGSRHAGDDGMDSIHFAALRLMPDGRIDRSFSDNGRVTIDFGYGNDGAEAVAIDRYGRVVMAGFGTRRIYDTREDFAFARLRRDGSLDPTFSGDGRRTVDFGTGQGDFARSVVALGDGRILATGSTYRDGARVGVVRLHGDGSLDASFGGDGRVSTHPGRYGGGGWDVLRHPGGGIFVVGYVREDGSTDPSYDWLIARYDGTGALDPSFGGDGIVRTDFGTGADVAMATALHRNGKIVVGGSIYTSQGLARYFPD